MDMFLIDEELLLIYQVNRGICEGEQNGRQKGENRNI